MRANTARAAKVGPLGRRGSRRARSHHHLVAGVLCFIVAAGSAVMSVPPAEAKSPGLDVVGFLPDVPKAPQTAGLHGTFFMDAPNRRLYTSYNDSTAGGTHLVEFDLDGSPVPTLIRDKSLGVTIQGWQRPNQIAVDSRTRTAYLLNSASSGSLITLIDLKTLKIKGEWSLAQLGAPEIVPLGITYSQEDGRVYIVGHATVNKTIETVAKSRVYTPVVTMALDATTGALVWRKVVTKCAYAMYTFGDGSLIARSDNHPVLYFACVKTEESPSQSGIVRMGVTPNATQSEMDTAPVDFFPISGRYTSGEGVTGYAGFDYAAERFYMVSQSSETPGAWVFDGNLSAWVGFIAASDEVNKGLGIDQGNGHVYMKSGSDGQLILADGRATPVPQGFRLDFDPMQGFYLVDPKTHRAFVWTGVKDATYGVRGEIAVIKDSTPSADSLRPPNYDALTQDIPESDKTVTAFSGSSNGYATRVVLVGGLPVNAGDARPGDRGVTAARIPSVDLREVAAQATAQAVVSDTNTEAELQEQGGREWPWRAATCLDGSGSKVEDSQEQQGGSAVVECDLAEQRVTATSTHSAIVAGDVTVGASRFTTDMVRDPDKGILTNVVSRTSGISIKTPQGSIEIGEVVARSTTAAHGRPGTTKATWERHLRGISVVDADGNSVVDQGRCSTTDKEDTCGPLIRQLNDVNQRVRIDLFSPEIVRTPKGAYAGIQQSDADYYQGRTVYNQGAAFALENASRATPAVQIVVYNDSSEKSRAIVQLGAIQAGSIYTVSKPPAPEPPDDPEDPKVPPVPPVEVEDPEVDPPTKDLPEVAPVELPGGEGVAQPLALDDQPTSASPPASPTTPVEAVKSVLAFFHRSPKEAALFTAFWVMLASSLWTVLRRRSLVEMLSQEVQ